MSMEDIVIINRDDVDLNRLRDLFNHAERTAAPLRFCVDDGTLKVKVGQGVWSPPMGARDPECEAHRVRFTSPPDQHSAQEVADWKAHARRVILHSMCTVRCAEDCPAPVL